MSPSDWLCCQLACLTLKGLVPWHCDEHILRVSVCLYRKRLEESGSETRRKLTELENQNGLLHSSLQSITSTSTGTHPD